jgi:uncharacterized membrane protein
VNRYYQPLGKAVTVLLVAIVILLPVAAIILMLFLGIPYIVFGVRISPWILAGAYFLLSAAYTVANRIYKKNKILKARVQK